VSASRGVLAAGALGAASFVEGPGDPAVSSAAGIDWKLSTELGAAMPPGGSGAILATATGGDDTAVAAVADALLI
jgi:hypothetical protein